LIRDLGVESHTVVVGSVWELLPRIYAITDVYCTPSIMEGFGMSAQEAAATGVPVIASNLVPFAREYLLGETPQEVRGGEDGRDTLLVGEGTIIVQPDDVESFARALEILLEDETLRESMGMKAYELTIPYFTWENITRSFLDEIGFGNHETEKGL
jgi:glycosyltransferase involved in cell wall biosynthesis